MGRSWLEQVGGIADIGRQILGRVALPRHTRDMRRACDRLLSQRGEASSVALAAEIVGHLTNVGRDGTEAFLDMLARSFAPDPDVLRRAVNAWSADASDASLLKLAAAIEPPRQELFRRLNMVPGGTKSLVGLRADLLRMLPEQPHLAPIDADLKHLFTSWFNRGFLQLEEITWATPADILERLIEYEAVHAIKGWADLRGRLAPDRRCFAFFHPALAREPLIFVEVALTRGLASDIAPLIEVARVVRNPVDADTAIFYSISNCQPGLRGISFGSFLIRQVMGELAARLRQITTYATLSPMPQFRAALLKIDDPHGFTEPRGDRLLGKSFAEVRRCVEADQPPSSSLDAGMRLLALAYVMRVRSGARVADSVGHFHLSNGARIERINPQADLSEGGRPSIGVMVNYLYDAAVLEVNHEQYIETGRVAVAPALRAAAARVNAAWD
jgi:malonyl-CoA decarboxylase